MDKQTKMYVGLGVAAVAGYLLYNQWKKKQPVAPVQTASFAGTTAESVVGDRKGMVGMDATMKQNAVVKDSKFAWGNFSAQNSVIRDGSWANAAGDDVAPTFFKVHDSANSFRNR